MANLADDHMAKVVAHDPSADCVLHEIPSAG